MSVREHKISLLIESFRKKESLTLGEIKEIINVRERAAKGYLEDLKSMGIKLVCKKGAYRIDDHNGEYNINILEGEEIDLPVINKQDVRILKIIHIISKAKNPPTRAEVIDLFFKDSDCKGEISEKTIKRDISKCILKGYLDECDGRYFVNKSIRTMESKDSGELYEFIDLCRVYGSNMPFYSELINLRDRVAMQADYQNCEDEIYSIGRKYKEKFPINKFMALVKNVDYKDRTVYVEFMSKKGLIKEYINIVSLIYSWDKDKGYIAGMAEDRFMFIDVDTVNVFEGTDEINASYKDSEIMKKINMMFGVSIDKEYKVEVEFDNKFNIYEKLKRLERNRGGFGKVHDQNDVILYTDTIYGLNEFAAYLRRFGTSCRVREPQELKDMMGRSYERILKNYGEEL